MRDRRMQVGQLDDDGAIAGKAPCLDRDVSLIVIHGEDDVVSAATKSGLMISQTRRSGIWSVRCATRSGPVSRTR